ncbi:MAG: hypothetical protein QOF48_2124 [Verrucomicrobiota bacterium]|jgi:hypothetical protein
MSGKKPHVTALELRKRLLIAESALNRAQLIGAWDSMTNPVRLFAVRAQSFSSMASSAASLLTGLATCGRGFPSPANGKPIPSWTDTILKGVRLAASVGLAFRANGHSGDAK